jgi:hypothetical protein
MNKLPIDTVPSPRFGTLNKYPVSVIEAHFNGTLH